MSRNNRNRRRNSNVGEYISYIIIGLLIAAGIIFVVHKILTDNKPIGLKTEAPTTEAAEPAETPTEAPTTAEVDPNRESTELTYPENAYFATADVNIRSKASTSGKSYGLLYKYHCVEVVSQSNGWSKIKYEAGEDGYAYVYSKYLSNDPEFSQEAKAFLQELADDEKHSSNIVSKTSAMYTYNDVVSDLNELAQKYPEKCHISTIGTTVDGRDIYLAKIGNQDATKKILVHANIHAREYMTTLLVMSQMEYYLDNYNYWYDKENSITYKDLFDEVCIYYIPTLNPDGMTIAQFGVDGLLTQAVKDKVNEMLGTGDNTIWKSNANGVDLNKQFPYGFGKVIMSKVPGYQNYAGASALTEKEAIALYDLVLDDPYFLCSIAYHSTGEDIYWDCNAEEAELQKTCKEIARVIADETGYNMNHNFENHNGYDTDWLINEMKIPAFTVETGNDTCPLPISQFYNIWKDNKNLIARLAAYLR